MKVCIDLLRSRNVSRIYFLGDSTGYLPLVTDVLELIRSEGIIPLMGNHDAMICGLMDIEKDRSDIYGFKRLTEEVLSSVCAEVTAWPKRRELDINGKKLLMVHGSPWDELNEYIYRDSDLTRFDDLKYDVVFMGHTHRSFVERRDDMLLVNAGSCGLPRDVGNMASCVFYDPKNNTAEILRTEFDVDRLMRESERLFPVPLEVKDCLERRET